MPYHENRDNVQKWVSGTRSCGRHCEMKVEIAIEGRLIDIIKEGFDAGVRLAEAVPRDMIAMPLGPRTRHVVVGAPSYFAKRPRPTTPVDLMDHECIRTRYPSGA